MSLKTCLKARREGKRGPPFCSLPRQEPFHRLRDVLAQGGRVADVHVGDLARLVDDDQCGEPAHVIFLRHSLGLQDRVIQLHLIDNELGILLFAVGVHSQDGHRLALEVIGEFFHLRHGPDTPAAAPVPEVEDDDLALVALERMCLAFKVLGLPVGGRLAQDGAAVIGFLGLVRLHLLVPFELHVDLLAQVRQRERVVGVFQRRLRLGKQALDVLGILARLGREVFIILRRSTPEGRLAPSAVRSQCFTPFKRESI